MMLLTEIIASGILGGLLARYSDIATVPANDRFIFIVISKMLFFLLVAIVTQLFSNINTRSALRTKYNATLILICSFTCTISFILFYICTSNSLNPFSERLMSFISIMLLTTNLYFAWLFDYNIKQQSIITDLEVQAQRIEDADHYYGLVIHQDEQQKILVHDIKNHLNAVHNLIQAGQYVEATNYLSNITNSSTLKHTVQPTSNYNFNLIMSRYITLCETQNIKFSLNAQGVNIDFFHTEDITSLFCNLMDNAVDASSNTIEKSIELRLTDNISHSQTVISLVNSCEQIPCISNHKKLKTTKKNKEKHGWGTKSIQYIVDKYNGTIEMYYSDTDNTFHTIILFQH